MKGCNWQSDPRRTARRKLKDASVGKVTVPVVSPVEKITATCTINEICDRNVLVTEKKLSESVEHTTLLDFKVADSANQSNGE